MLNQQSERSRYHYTPDELAGHFSFPTSKSTTLSTLFDQITSSALSALAAHQLIYLLQRERQQKLTSITTKVVDNLHAIRRPTEHTFTVFTLKILLDFWNEDRIHSLNQYQIGGIAGFIGYWIGRPIDQMDLARKEILANEKKYISRIEAISVILKHDGFRGFYRNENLLGPLCPTIYRSVFFGVWSKLLAKTPIHNEIVDLVAIPFVASFAASLASAIPDKLRSFSLNINEAKRRSLEKVYGKKTIPDIKKTAQLLV